MYDLKQFIVWHRVKRNDGRVDKIPIHPQTLKNHNAHSPNIWMHHDKAVEATSRLGTDYGVGFVFTSEDPYWFIDIDDCLIDTGWSPIVHELRALLPNAAVEVSQSGRGIHYIGSGEVPHDRIIKSKAGFDLYTDGRFVALTGTGDLQGDPTINSTAEITEVCRRYLQVEQGSAVENIGWTTTARDDWDGPADDDELIRRALRSQSAAGIFGGRATFRELWEGNTARFGEYWPDDSGLRDYDHSKADSALAQHLAFWTGCNCERIQRLMLQSAMPRDKWDRPDYLPRTITGVVVRQQNVYQQKQSAADTNKIAETYLGIDKQIEYFRGCVYIQNVHKILTPDGSLLQKEQFRAMYGGYIFSMDRLNEKTTKSAWEAFTESRGYRFPKVVEAKFLPQEEPGAVIGREYVNTFVPRWGTTKKGDVSRFQRHLELLLPIEQDREILTSYLAACLQQAGTKFQWAPCIQGVEGNGKTAFYHVLEYALGAEYCHQLDPGDLGNVFNGWIERKLLVCVEEIRVAGKYDMADRLKPLITNLRVPLQPKGVDQRTGSNCANFILFSNYKDAVLKTKTDRRYCVFYTAQQEPEDLKKHGMDRAYFRDLYSWLRADGCSLVTDWLSTYNISVDMCGRAPKTSVTDEAIRHSYGTAEQIVLEAIEMDEFGFRGGLVDTKAVQLLLTGCGKRISPQGIANLLKSLDYVKHPALEASQGKLMVDGVRKRIYVKKESIAANLKTPEAIAESLRRLAVQPEPIHCKVNV
jgi:hypothetical protein